jgi:glucose/arabinose dehydrogenase
MSTSRRKRKLESHAAALGMRFYTGRMFPAEYRNRIIVARHGSWNRTQKTGHDLVQVTPGQNKMETFASG